MSGGAFPWAGDLLDWNAEPSKSSSDWPMGASVVLAVLGTATSYGPLVESVIDQGLVQLFTPVVLPGILSVLAAWIFIAKMGDNAIPPIETYRYPQAARHVAKVVHVVLALLVTVRVSNVIRDEPRTIEGYLCQSRVEGPVGGATIEVLDAAGQTIAEADRPTSSYDGYFRINIKERHYPAMMFVVRPKHGGRYVRPVSKSKRGTGCPETRSDAEISGWMIYADGE